MHSIQKNLEKKLLRLGCAYSVPIIHRLCPFEPDQAGHETKFVLVLILVDFIPKLISEIATGLRHQLSL